MKYRPWGKDLYDVVLAAREVDVEVPVAALLSQIARGARRGARQA